MMQLYVKIGKIADYDDCSDVYPMSDEELDKIAQEEGYDNYEDMVDSGDHEHDPYEPEYNSDLIDAFIKHGYEGFNDDGNGGFVLWEIDNWENRIKSADLVTYDDNGNIIPLSKRFDGNSPDIRY